MNYFLRNLSMCLLYVVLFSMIVCTIPDAHALEGDPQSKTLTATDLTPVTLRRLDSLVVSLEAKAAQRRDVVLAIKEARDDDQKPYLDQLEALNKEIANLRAAFEVLAVGEDPLEEDSQSKPFDWRADLAEIVQPLLDSLKKVTDRPRKLEQLRQTIERNDELKFYAVRAREAVQLLLTDTKTDQTAKELEKIVAKWVEKEQTAIRDQEIASAQLEHLLNDEESSFLGVVQLFKEFFLGRGLTLVIAMLVAIAAWVCMRFLWWFYDTKIATKEIRRNSLKYRVFAYGFRLFTIAVIVLAVIFALYLRGDVLLLALVLVIIAVSVIGLRNVLPKFVREARLLLNVGPIREEERVIYADLPWEVMSINIMSVLRNPELEGIVRLPLSSMTQLTSRPFKDRLWFPTSVGDAVLLAPDSLMVVTRQTPEIVELTGLAGDRVQYPAAAFFSMTMVNLSRSETFGVTVEFGVDYAHQSICLTQIPKAFREYVEQTLAANGFSSHVSNLIIDLKSAGASSLDYIVVAVMKREAAQSYFLIQRLLVQACIQACNDRSWNIPFPQLSVHYQPSEPINAIGLFNKTEAVSTSVPNALAVVNSESE